MGEAKFYDEPSSPGPYKTSSENLEMASIKLLNSQTKPGSRQHILDRVWDEETTRLAESLEGPLHSRFEFMLNENGQLVTALGNNLTEMWQTAFETSANNASKDIRLKDIAKIRQAELAEGLAVEQFSKQAKADDVMVVISAYPEELELAHGKDFLEGQGFNPSRRLGFIRTYAKINNGISLETKSFDSSALAGLKVMLSENNVATDSFNTTLDLLNTPMVFKGAQTEITSLLIASYDSNLQRQTGLQHTQGLSAASTVETWSFVTAQKDVLNFYIDGLVNISGGISSYNDQLLAKQKLTYSVMATLENRYKHKHLVTPRDSKPDINTEVSRAGALAAEAQKTYTACGITISPQQTEQQALLAITQAAASKTLKCVKCPYCTKTVDAKQTSTTISCPECKTTVNKNNGQVTRAAQSQTLTKIFEEFLEDLFNIKKPPQSKS